MKLLDRILRDRRVKWAARFLQPDDVVVDVGCADGAMFEQLKGRYGFGYGIDPTLASPVSGETYALYPGTFPEALPAEVAADRITLLATLEHLSPEEQQALAEGCRDVLRPGGTVVITVPSPRVDDVLHVLAALRLIDGMEMHEHYGFQPADTLKIFGGPEFKLVQHKRFQLGLNNLFVFERVEVAVPAPAVEVLPTASTPELEAETPGV
jgi:SAM-dependent methyltransferase